MRKRKFKTVTVAALAAMTLTGMNAFPVMQGSPFRSSERLAVPL